MASKPKKNSKTQKRWETYQFCAITSLLRSRENGRSLQRICHRKRQHQSTDFELLKSLYCNPGAYLETIACRKIPQSKAASYCHGRLFIDNYRACFNTFTGPTSGPRIMKSHLLKTEEFLCNERIVDATAVDAPNNCAPPRDQKCRSSQLLLLSKSGWLIQMDLETCDIVDRIFIPSRHFNPEFCNDPASSSFTDSPSKINFNYLCIASNRDSESFYVKSAQTSASSNTKAVAMCVFGLYPLRVKCHFVVTMLASTRNVDLINDLLFFSITKSSMFYFFSLSDIIKEYSFGNELQLKQNVILRTGDIIPEKVDTQVGSKLIGIPYTMRHVPFSAHNMQKGFSNAPCLFSASAIKHSLQLGGTPYHYLVPTCRNGTSWSVRDVATDAEVTSGALQMVEKWDSSHWQGFRFVPDYGLVKHNLNSMELLQIEAINHSCNDNKKGKHIDESTIQSKIVKLLEIDISPIPTACSSQPRWVGPSHRSDTQALPAHTVTSSGRPIRRPRPLSYCVLSPGDEPRHSLISVEHEPEMNFVALLYYRPTGKYRVDWDLEEGGSELVISVFDSHSGAWLQTFHLQSDVSPCDRDALSILVDQETIAFTRLPAGNSYIEYKILRLHRKYGSCIPHNWTRMGGLKGKAKRR